MAYTNVDTILQTARTGGDIFGRVQVGLLKQAVVRSTIISNASDQRERTICRAIIDGQALSAWVAIVLQLLDMQGQLAAPTDAQIDTQVVAGWAYILGSR